MSDKSEGSIHPSAFQNKQWDEMTESEKSERREVSLIKAARSAEAQRDHYKALCEELARLCEKALTRSAIVHPGFADEIRAALKKAQKDI